MLGNVSYAGGGTIEDDGEERGDTNIDWEGVKRHHSLLKLWIIEEIVFGAWVPETMSSLLFGSVSRNYEIST